MAKEMTARFPGTCIRTGLEVRPGDRIIFHGKGRVELLRNAELERARASETGRGRTRPVSDTFTFSSGHTAYRNARGRCEDAPCCGCCTI
jgi:hypothetical protein